MGWAAEVVTPSSSVRTDGRYHVAKVNDEIAAGLNQRGIPTATGHGAWSAVQVRRVLERLAHRGLDRTFRSTMDGAGGGRLRLKIDDRAYNASFQASLRLVYRTGNGS
jgi:hypothetical protein